MPTLPYQPGSETSRDAARQAAKKAPILRAQMLAAYEARGTQGFTDEELGDHLHLAGNTVRPRRCELAKGGHIVRSGEKRGTKAGRTATVWRKRLPGEPEDVLSPRGGRGARPTVPESDQREPPPPEHIALMAEAAELLERLASAMWVSKEDRRRAAAAVSRLRDPPARRV